MPLARSVNELLDMVNYLGKFTFNLVKHTTTLHNFLKKDVVFTLQKPQLDANENSKTLVTSAPCLKTSSSELLTSSRTDASSVGLGVFLEQNYKTVDNNKWHLIVCLSQTLKTTENVMYRWKPLKSQTIKVNFQ